jgi:hypothetical protein
MKKKQKNKVQQVKKLSLIPSEMDMMEQECGGDKELALFAATYIKNELNASKTYKILHKKCSDDSCRVLGSRMVAKLAKVNINLLLGITNCGEDLYIQKIKDGLGASDVELKAITTGKGKKKKITLKEIIKPNHSVQIEYHNKLGKLLGFEGKENNANSVAVQVNNLISEKKNDYGI